MDGEADEILMWPLGGLAFVLVPHTPRANFITAVGGPMVNVLICLGCRRGHVRGRLPAADQHLSTSQLYYPELHNWQTGEDGKPYDDIAVYVDKKTGKAHLLALVCRHDDKYLGRASTAGRQKLVEVEPAGCRSIRPGSCGRPACSG